MQFLAERGFAIVGLGADVQRFNLPLHCVSPMGNRIAATARSTSLTFVLRVDVCASDAILAHVATVRRAATNRQHESSSSHPTGPAECSFATPQREEHGANTRDDSQ